MSKRVAAAGVGLQLLLAPRATKRAGTPPHEAIADLGEALALLRSRFAPIGADPRSSLSRDCSNFNA